MAPGTPLSSVEMDGLTIERFIIPTELTIEVTARFLQMSEHRVNDLLDAGRIEFRQDNGERLVQWESLLAFDLERQQIGRALRKMAMSETIKSKNTSAYSVSVSESTENVGVFDTSTCTDIGISAKNNFVG